MQPVFQCGVKQKKAPHEMLGSLKGVVSKKTHIGCGFQEDSYRVWSSFIIAWCGLRKFS